MKRSGLSLVPHRHSFMLCLVVLVMLALWAFPIPALGALISDTMPHPFNPALRTYLDFEIDRKKFLYKRWLDRQADEYNEDVQFQIVDLERRIPETRSSFTDTPLIPLGAPTIVSFRVPIEKDMEFRERYAVLYVPAATTIVDSVSLLMMFHNLEGNCLDFTTTTRVTEYAERDGFIVASMCGSMGRYGISWNAGTCCGFTDDEPNEEQLTRAMVNILVDAFPKLDPTKVAVLGLENGALLAQGLACKAPDMIRAVVSLGGVVSLRPGMSKGLEECDVAVQKRRQADEAPWGTHLLIIHSDVDSKVSWKGDFENRFPSVEDNLGSWVKREGCDTELAANTLRTQEAENVLYSKCNVNTVNYTKDLSFIQREEDQSKVRIFRALKESGEASGDESSIQMHPRMRANLQNDLSKYATPTVEFVRLKGIAKYFYSSDDGFDTLAYAFSFLQRAMGLQGKSRSFRGAERLPPKNPNVTVDEILRRHRATERTKNKKY